MKQTPFGLVGGITIVGVLAWTLIPNSHSLMVIWPGVLLWQIVVLLPIIWLWLLFLGLKQNPFSSLALGGGLDWLMAGGVGVIILSTIASSSPEFSRWYGLSALGAFAAVYALNRVVLVSPGSQFLWELQGWIGILFSLESLGLWGFNVYFPEQKRLETLQTQYGVSLQFDFSSQLDFQNWYPLGHQNYVAGYLVLTFPLLVGLWIKALMQGQKRYCWLWGIGVGLQILDLYNTSSRGGWLALLGILCGSLLLMIRLYPLRVVLPIVLGGLTVMIGGLWSNDRLRSFILALVQGLVQRQIQGQGENSQFTYRLITHQIGWNMGISHPWTGLGLGSVPLLYQAYRPIWAGEEAELHYQLHSTPAQLWAELGIGGVTIALGLMVLILFHFWRWIQCQTLSKNVSKLPSEPNFEQNSEINFQGNLERNVPIHAEKNLEKRSTSILAWSSAASLLGYSLMALTDYQLDTLAISGSFILSLVLFWRSVLPPVQLPLLQFPPVPGSTGLLMDNTMDRAMDKTIENHPISYLLRRNNPHPPAPSPFLGEGADQSPSPRLGEGFRVRDVNSYPISFPYLPFHRFLHLSGIGMGLAVLLWLMPVHYAWATAQRGFDALGSDRRDEFIKKVSTAHGLAPWDPYYALQLGWNLGEFSTQNSDPKQAQIFRQNAIHWFQKAIETAPFQEFSHSNLGWLFLQDGQPREARLEFEKAVQLVPTKEGLWFALGLSEGLDQQMEAAIESFVRELLRHPLGITNPLWQANPLNTIQNQVFDRLDQFCSDQLADPTLQTDEALLTYLHNVRGGLRWWRGDFSGAKIDWNDTKMSIGLAILNLEYSPNLTDLISLDSLPESSGKFLLKAWKTDPEKWFNQAWKNSLQNTNTLPTLSQAIVLQSLREAKSQNRSLGDWIKDLRHYQSYRPDRLGFGVLSRHLGGSIPKDYGLDYENLLISGFLPELFPERSYFPSLDQRLPQWFPPHGASSTPLNPPIPPG